MYFKLGGNHLDKFVVEFSYDEKFNAGSKARDDIKVILKKKGFEYLLYKSKKIGVTIINDIFKFSKNLIKSIPKESLVVVQLPILISNIYLFPLIAILKLKKCKIIFLIHDVVTLRLNEKPLKIRNEIVILNRADYIISHNKYMTNWLQNNGVKKKVVNLELFDYIVEHSKNLIRHYDVNKCKVVYAGNLSQDKSGFIYKLNECMCNVQYNLYGINYKKNKKIKNINYKGFFKPNDLLDNIEGDYGLIWDGTDIDECNGIFGEYMKYNNPHKISLYISAGLPVIVWDKAAISDFVRQNKIGILVESINEIENKLSNISENEYIFMKNNVQCLRDKITKGEFTNLAIDKILKDINLERK